MLGVRVDGQRRAAQDIEASHFVEAHDVVGVRVGEEDRVDASDAVPQGLRAQVRRRVHEHAGAVVALEVDRRPGRLSRGSVEWQTAQSQPIMGTPCDVPVPRKCTRTKVEC